MQVTVMEGNADQLFDLSEKTAEVLADDGQTIEIAISTGTGEVLLHLKRGEPVFTFTAADVEQLTRKFLQLEQELPA